MMLSLATIPRRHEPDIFSLKLPGSSFSSGPTRPSIGLANLGCPKRNNPQVCSPTGSGSQEAPEFLRLHWRRWLKHQNQQEKTVARLARLHTADAMIKAARSI